MASNGPIEQFASARGVHINVPLTTFSIGYHPDGFIAEQLFPVVPVVHESDYYYVWDQASAFRRQRTDGYDSLVADGAIAKRVDFGATPDIYKAEKFAHTTRITDRQKQNQDPVLRLEISKTRRAQDLCLIDQELRVANIVTAAASYATANKTTLSGTSQWNNASFVSQTSGTFSVIEQNFDNGKEAIRQSTGGKQPNVAVIPAAVAKVMKRDVGVRDSIKYTHADILTNGDLPEMLWGMKVLIPAAVYDNSVENETYTPVDIWGKSVILAYVEPNPGLDALTFGSIFRARAWQVRQWRNEEEEATYYEPGVIQAEKAVSFSAAYLIQNAIA